MNNANPNNAANLFILTFSLVDDLEALADIEIKPQFFPLAFYIVERIPRIKLDWTNGCLHAHAQTHAGEHLPTCEIGDFRLHVPHVKKYRPLDQIGINGECLFEIGHPVGLAADGLVIAGVSWAHASFPVTANGVGAAREIPLVDRDLGGVPKLIDDTGAKLELQPHLVKIFEIRATHA